MNFQAGWPHNEYFERTSYDMIDRILADLNVSFDVKIPYIQAHTPHLPSSHTYLPYQTPYTHLCFFCVYYMQAYTNTAYADLYLVIIIITKLPFIN